ncbi:GNAT family N-acetyltransferase [Nocardioides sp.]|nr:GNAT family N-acetyltransferase [Nocardioides sp.]
MIRPATPDDLATIDRFIRALAAEEGLPAVTATLDDLEAALFGPTSLAAALVVQVGTVRVGFALYYPKYGTVSGRRGIHLEDLYVTPELRNQRVGERVMTHLARLAGERGVLEWWVQHSNHAALRFYQRLGGQELADIAVYRLERDALQELVD